MARPIVLSNNELHVGLSRYGEVSDVYFPYVGLENHTIGSNTRHRVGVWVDGRVSWLSDGGWTFKYNYHHEALIGHIAATNEQLGIMLEFDDAVDTDFNALLRTIHVVNMRAEARNIRLFMHQAFIIGDSGSNTDTVQVLPDDNAIVHYRGRRTFVVSGQVDGGAFFDQYAVGVFGLEGREGTYRDADDGELSNSTAEHGRVDSTIRFKLEIAGHGSVRVNYWLACGTSLREALYIHKSIISQTIHKRLAATAKWWRLWLRPAKKIAQRIEPEYRQTFVNSTIIIKAHIDKRGAIIASSDGEALNYQRDAYAYCWPRDSAYAIWPLIRMGYTEEAYNFFDFCRRALSSRGYLSHKYRADGALGSSWHSYVHPDGTVSAPIQEDETASVLFLFCQFYNKTRDDALLQRFYMPLVVPMANFLSSYIDNRTHLPKPSYDLWEEHFMVTTYTTAVVQAALFAAANLADQRQDEVSAVAWRTVAEDIKQAAQERLYDGRQKAFRKGLRRNKNGTYTPDETIDMSGVYGAFIYDLVGDNELDDVVKTALDRFGFALDKPGLPRYEGDAYYRSSDDSPSNWWFIVSLWLAQYYLNRGDEATARHIVSWVANQAWPTGILPEQADPVSGQGRSVAPLCWSQAEFASTILDIAKR